MTGTVFRFRLERVRAVRERREKLAQQELAEAISQRSSTEDALRGVEEEIRQAHVEQRSAANRSGTVSAAEMLAHQAFLERIEAQRGLRAAELRLREAEVLERDASLVTASSEHEMLKRLRERHRGEHNRELARQESNVLDEIATVRFGRSTA